MHRQQRQESGRNLAGYSSAGLSLSESNSNAVADYPSTSRYYSSCGSVWRVRSSVPSGSRVPPTGSGASSGANGAYNSPSRCSRSTMSCPRLVSLLACSATLLLISSCIGLADAGILNGHPLGKRSFIDIQCKGIYDKSIFARLDRICEDCYNLFREPQLHQLCRKNCFTSDYFKGCLDVLLLQDEMEKIQTWIKQLHGAEPGV